MQIPNVSGQLKSTSSLKVKLLAERFDMAEIIGCASS